MVNLPRPRSGHARVPPPSDVLYASPVSGMSLFFSGRWLNIFYDVLSGSRLLPLSRVIFWIGLGHWTVFYSLRSVLLVCGRLSLSPVALLHYIHHVPHTAFQITCRLRLRTLSPRAPSFFAGDGSAFSIIVLAKQALAASWSCSFL